MELSNVPITISYTANLTGVISSYLASMQGNDIMALEMIQNADDAKANEICFNITTEGLWVTNDKHFTHCGHLENPTCAYIHNLGKSCDFHRIANVSSGGKRFDSENIGRFGIGFVSAYQVTDRPEIHSSGVLMRLSPLTGNCEIIPTDHQDGTSFFFPWATDAASPTRLALAASPFKMESIDQLQNDIKSVLMYSLQFLKHVRNAKLQRDGKTIFACLVKPLMENTLQLKFSTGEPEDWYLMHTDAKDQIAQIVHQFPQLNEQGRKTTVTLAIRLKPSPSDGYVYAYLPTKQSTGLPLHINGDFFPETDRKSPIFSGNQHQQAWNTALISAAAICLAQNLTNLIKIMDPVSVWKIILQTNKVFTDKGYPDCFKAFWQNVIPKASETRLALSHDGQLHLPKELFLTEIALESPEARVLGRLDIDVFSETMRPYYSILRTLGAPVLKLDVLQSRIQAAMTNRSRKAQLVEDQELQEFYIPLWKVFEKLIPDKANSPALDKNVKSALIALQDMPLVVSESRRPCSMDECVVVRENWDPTLVSSLLPKMLIANREIMAFSKLAHRIASLGFKELVKHLSDSSRSHATAEFIRVDREGLQALYQMLAKFSHLEMGKPDEAYLSLLKKSRIWLSTKGCHITLEKAVMPGDFNDPTEMSDILDDSIMDDDVKYFVRIKLGVKHQTYEQFILHTLPELFDEQGPNRAELFESLIYDLACHQELLLNEEIKRTLTYLPLAPTMDGKWARPNQVYERTDELAKLLGDQLSYWLDTTRLPNPEVLSLYQKMGILADASIPHLVKRIVTIAVEHLSDDNSRQQVGEAFYKLCDYYKQCSNQEARLEMFKMAIAELKSTACLPAVGDRENWYSPNELFEPFMAHILPSKAKVLDFRSTQLISTSFLEALGLLNPNVGHAIQHLRECIKLNKAVQSNIYSFLDSKASEKNYEIHSLIHDPCIYITNTSQFVRPSRVFERSENLGRFAFELPSYMLSMSKLIACWGIKHAPETCDYMEILQEISNDAIKSKKPVPQEDTRVYWLCIQHITDDYLNECLDEDDLETMKSMQIILNLQNTLVLPKDVLLHDSEWYAGFFGNQLDKFLCKPPAECAILFAALDVEPLSDRAAIVLHELKGMQRRETAIKEKFDERIGILMRLLYLKSNSEKDRIREAVSNITFYSCTTIKVKIKVKIGDHTLESGEKATDAYFSFDKKNEYLTQPINEKSWIHVYRAILKCLLPTESDADIKSTVLNMANTISQTLEFAHDFLTEIDYPLDDDWTLTETDRLHDCNPNENESSAVISEEPSKTAFEKIDANYGNEWLDESEHSEPDIDLQPILGELSDFDESETSTEPHTSSMRFPNCPTDPNKGPGKVFSSDSNKELDTDFMNEIDDEADIALNNGRAPLPRATHEPKRQMDRRLVSYVEHEQLGREERNNTSESYSHNLAIEEIARNAVCRFEAENGWVAEQMPETHPGYDIKSRDPNSGMERYIEVKGIRGEWNQTGVGLSKRQFELAQELKDQFWLYVVEHASSLDTARVYPICNPAQLVSVYMFDGKWRGMAATQSQDPMERFKPEARIEVNGKGVGKIIKTETWGSTLLLSIAFDHLPDISINVPYNLSQMRIIEE